MMRTLLLLLLSQLLMTIQNVNDTRIIIKKEKKQFTIAFGSTDIVGVSAVVVVVLVVVEVLVVGNML